MEKLIRHRLPDIPRPSYPSMQTRVVNDIQEHVQLLILKLFEESHEVSIATSEDNLISEYADMLEVADTLVYLSLYPEGKIYISLHIAISLYKNILADIRKSGIGEQRVYEKKLEKLRNKGGFRLGVVWIY